MAENETTTVAHSGASPHTRTQVMGLVLLGTSLLVLLAVAAVAELDLGEVAVFMLPPAAVALVAAMLVWRFGTWAKVVGVVAALGIGGMLFFFVFGILEPASVVDFVMGVTFLLGFLLAVGGGIAAIVRRRATGPSPSERTVTRGAIGIVVLAVVVSVPMWLAGRQTVAEADVAGATSVVLHDFDFDPGEFAVASGTTLLVENDDPFLHTFTIDELDVDVELLPGDEALVTVDAAPGTYVYYCRPHSSPDDPDPDGEDMAGTLTVE